MSANFNPSVRVEGFIITDKLGTGSYASVYKAYDKVSNKEVAVKCIDKREVTKNQADSIIREIQILKMLEHPYVAKMIDFFWDDRYVYIVLEYCNGGDLSMFIKEKRRIPEMVCKKFMIQLVEGLKYLRSKDIYHYDLKPQNILINRGSELALKISDFGLSLFAHKNLENDIAGVGPRGSPSYMAPEVLNCDNYDPSLIDLWSLGVILYECLHGKLPLPQRTVAGLVEAIRKCTPIKIDSRLSMDSKNLLRQLLSYDPKGRITFEQLLKHPFIELDYTPPTEDTYRNAIRAARDAVRSDYEKDYHGAFNKYCHALKYMVPFVTKGTDETRKSLMLNKIHQCATRAINLVAVFAPAKIYFNMTPDIKEGMTPASSELIDSDDWSQQSIEESDSSESLTESEEIAGASKSKEEGVEEEEKTEETLTQPVVDDLDEASSVAGKRKHVHLTGEQVGLLKTMAKPTPKMYDGLDVGYSAQMYLCEGKYREAIDKFMLALSLLIPVLRKEPCGKRRELLTIQVKEWLDQAESIKTLLKANDELQQLDTNSPQRPSSEDEENNMAYDFCRII